MRVCERNGLTKPIIHQPSYNMLNRWVEDDLLPVTGREGLGVICFCPLSQGLLTGKYLDGIPDDSRAASKSNFLQREAIKPETVAKLKKLNDVAQQRGQTLAQMALKWVVRDERVTSALIGASRPGQIKENVKAMAAADFSEEELTTIDAILAS
jgi:L-glyceraldehyde 3-phosphate reductase